MLPRGFLRGVLLPAAECLTSTRCWTYYKDSLRFDRWDTGRRHEVSHRRLAQVWNAALGTALHRQRLGKALLPIEAVRAADVREFLERLEPVRKAAFRGHFPTGVTNGEQTGDWRFQSTAGTTDRMTVIANFRKRDHNRGSEWRALEMALGVEVGVNTLEIPPNACNIVCGLLDTGPPSFSGYFWQATRQGKLFSRESLIELRGRFERELVLRVRTLPPLEPLPAAQLAGVLDLYLKQIAAFRPVYLRGFPLYLLWLADQALDRSAAVPGLQAVGPYGGLASPVMMDRIANGLRCPFVQKYGTSELGVVAAACGRSPGMHLFEDLFHVEVLRRGQPVAPREVGRITITDLINTAMPLIRYDVGDVGRLHIGPCPCGRQTPRLEVMGRSQEVLHLAAGVLTASEVADTFFADPHTANFRLEETAPGSFEAAWVARASGGAAKVEAWRERFAALHGGVRRLRVRVVPFVQPESSGKYRFVFPYANGNEAL